MAAGFDVASRLAEGLAAVDDMQTYVSASRMRGYQDPDLASHGAQVHDWYGSEDGLDLQALDADCAALRAAAESADEAARLAGQQVSALSGAWTGAGADAAADFLRRHGDSAAALARAVRLAAETCTGLREELWRIVDRRVEATMTVAQGADPHREAWLTACRSVLAGDVTGKDAAEVVESQVKPFVHSVIRGEWVSAMQSATAAAAGAYRTAIDAIRPGHIRFDVPGELGPPGAASHTPLRAPAPDPPSAATSGPERDDAPGVSPSRFSAPVAQQGLSTDGWALGPAQWLPADAWAAATPAATPTPPNALPGAPPPPSDAWAAGTPLSPPNALDAWASPASWPTAGALRGLSAGALPDGGLPSAIPNTLGNALGGLLDSVAAPSPDLEPLAIDDPADASDVSGLDEPAAGRAPDDEDEPAGEDPASGDGQQQPSEPGEAPDDGELVAGSEPKAAADAAEAAPTTTAAPELVAEPPSGAPPDPPPTAPPAVSPPPSTGGETPCEIAADELPQAGQ